MNKPADWLKNVLPVLILSGLSQLESHHTGCPGVPGLMSEDIDLELPGPKLNKKWPQK